MRGNIKRVTLITCLVLAGGCSDDSSSTPDVRRDSGQTDAPRADQRPPPDLAPDTAAEASPDLSPDTGVPCPTYTPLADNISTDTTLDGCYLVEQRISVGGAATLTIAPGSVLMFKQDTGLDINADGALVAQGTSSAPILFTAEHETRGYWRGIRFHNTHAVTNILEHATIEFGGSTNPSFGEKANLALTSSGDPVGTTIKNCILRQSGGYGFFFDKNAEVPSFADNTVTQNAVGAGFVEGDAASLLDKSTTFAGNDEKLVWVEADALSKSQTWAAIDVPYVVNGALSINKAPGITLTIEAGATLLFGTSSGFEVGDQGALTAQGSSSAPITFDWAVDGMRWRGIRFHNSPSINNVMEHVVIDHGGNYDFSYGEKANLALTSSGNTVRLSLTKVTLRNSAGYGFFFDKMSEVPAFSDSTVTENELGAGYVEGDAAGLLESSSTYSGNTVDQVWVEADALTKSQTWAAIDVPYVVNSELSVNNSPGITLTIAAGATLLFQADAGLNIGTSGALHVQGTSTAPVTFDWALASAPWRGIRFHNSDSPANLLERVVIDHAGAYKHSYGDKANLALTSSGNPVRLTLTDSIIQNSGGYGVWVDKNGTLTESGNTFSGNTSSPDIYYEP